MHSNDIVSASMSFPNVRKTARIQHAGSAAFVDFENIRYPASTPSGSNPIHGLAGQGAQVRLMAVARAYADFDQHPLLCACASMWRV